MAFKLVSNLYGGNAVVAPPKDVREFATKDDAAGTVKQGWILAYDANNEEVIKCDGTKLPALIALEDAARNTSVRAAYVLPGMVFKCKVASTTHIKEGRVNMRLDADGKTVLDGDNADGAVNVLRVDGTDVYVTFGNTLVTKVYDAT